MNTLKELEQKINYTFQSPELLKQAITHKSHTNEKKLKYSYERFEFLGDTILQMVISDYLIDKYPNLDEGKLSKHRTLYVSESALSSIARNLEIGKYIFFGKGENRSGGADKDSILADVVESIIAAIYKDSGLGNAKKFIYEHIITHDVATGQDYKTRLQETLKNHGNELHYDVVEVENGFSAAAYYKNQILGYGTGRNKKSAAQLAAGMALNTIKEHPELIR